MEENVRGVVYRSPDRNSTDNRDNGRFRQVQAEVDRFWSKVRFERHGCWLWVGGTTDDGYGRFVVTVAPGVQRVERAHRYAWKLLRGPIRPGYTLDHLIGPDEPCTSTLCVRVFDHLEDVTNSENLSRRWARQNGTDR